MKYLICWALGDGEEPLFTESQTPVLCEDVAAVSEALASQRKKSEDEGLSTEWSIYELAAGRLQRRSVTFSSGGRTILSVQ